MKNGTRIETTGLGKVISSLMPGRTEAIEDTVGAILDIKGGCVYVNIDRIERPFRRTLASCQKNCGPCTLVTDPTKISYRQCETYRAYAHDAFLGAWKFAAVMG